MTAEWRPDDPRLTRIVFRKELVASGWNDRAIARAVARGELHRVRHGTYVDAAPWRLTDEIGRHAIRGRAVVQHAQTPLVLSHVSAIGEWDVAQWGLPLEAVHTTRDDQRAGRKEAGVHQHLGALRDEDVVSRNGIRVTAVARTLLDTMSMVDVERGLVVVNDALHQQLTSHDDLAACATYMEQWPGSLRHRVVLRLADGRLESVGESRVFHLCWDRGLPLPIPQWEVHDAQGRLVARLDFAWPWLGLFAEFDGKVKYRPLSDEGPDAVEVVVREKRREDLVRQITGRRCVRLTWDDLSRPAHTADTLRRLLSPAAARN